MEDLHERIKQLRVGQGFTLKDVSARTGLSLSFISQVERGASSLSVSSLNKIAEALGVPITYFFEPDDKDIRYAVRKEEQQIVRMRGGDPQYVRLAGQFSNRKLEPMQITLPPGFHDRTYNHDGEEWYYVIKGEVTFTIAEKEYIIGEGEAMHFPSRLEHEWANTTRFPAKMLSVTTPVIFQ